MSLLPETWLVFALGTSQIKIQTDSSLVINQVTGEFVSKEDGLLGDIPSQAHDQQ